tara:strand:+ start:131 stop:310 length:180 start_codon:yes stop_codon:yes gene_type:complete
MKVKLFNNAQALTLNALEDLNEFRGLEPQTLKLLVKVVGHSLNQLEQTEQLKKHNIKLN